MASNQTAVKLFFTPQKEGKYIDRTKEEQEEKKSIAQVLMSPVMKRRRPSTIPELPLFVLQSPVFPEIPMDLLVYILAIYDSHVLLFLSC